MLTERRSELKYQQMKHALILPAELKLLKIGFQKIYMMV